MNLNLTLFKIISICRNRMYHLQFTSCFTTRLRCNLSSQQLRRSCQCEKDWLVNSCCSFVRYYINVPKTDHTSNENPVLSFKQPKFEDISFDCKVTHEDVMSALQKCKSVEEQMEALVSTLSLTREDVEKRHNFCKTLETFFKPFFKDFKIQIFGSTVNGFGFKGCDIDMTFQTASRQKSETYYLEAPDVPLVSEVLSGKVSLQEVSDLPEKEKLLFLHTVMIDYYNASDIPSLFINAYVPLVRFYHDKYNLKCDLTLRNRVAYANTKLLYFFTKLDNRVIPLMMTIRYWAKHLELIGKGQMFNTYTITLMVIYFLQSRSPPVLPDAQYVLSLSDKFEVEDMNDKTFLDILENIPSSKNTQTLRELLHEFFFFYLYFDFTRVICPLNSASISREEFFSAPENEKFRMSTMCVQDPLCTPHNVAELVDYKHCRLFTTEMMIACKMLQDNLVFEPSSSPWGIMTLLDKPKQYAFKKVSHPKSISLKVPFIVKSTDTKTCSIDNMTFSLAMFLNILQDVMLFQCNELQAEEVLSLLQHQDELFAKQKKVVESINDTKMPTHLSRKRKNKKGPLMEFENDAPAEMEETMCEQFMKCNQEHKLVLCTRCIASKNVWLGREMFERESVNVSGNILEKERSISLQVAHQYELHISDKKVSPFEFLFECYISADESTSFLIHFRPLHKMSFNPILGIFLKEYIPKIALNLNKAV